MTSHKQHSHQTIFFSLRVINLAGYIEKILKSLHSQEIFPSLLCSHIFDALWENRYIHFDLYNDWSLEIICDYWLSMVST